MNHSPAPSSTHAYAQHAPSTPARAAPAPQTIAHDSYHTESPWNYAWNSAPPQTSHGTYPIVPSQDTVKDHTAGGVYSDDLGSPHRTQESPKLLSFMFYHEQVSVPYDQSLSDPVFEKMHALSHRSNELLEFKPEQWVIFRKLHKRLQQAWEKSDPTVWNNYAKTEKIDLEVRKRFYAYWDIFHSRRASLKDKDFCDLNDLLISLSKGLPESCFRTFQGSEPKGNSYRQNNGHPRGQPQDQGKGYKTSRRRR